MRSAQKSNRSRGRGNRKGGGGNNLNRVYDSAGPEGKVRGTPQQIIDKYLTLARDAQTSGDRVTAENFLQHAEHYQRILIQATAQQQEQSKRDAPDQQPSEQQARQPQDAGDAPQPSMDTDTQAPAPAAAESAAPTESIGGMTMIDAEPTQDTLLVDSDEMAKTPPRRNGAGRRRGPKKDTAEAKPAEPQAEAAEPQPEA
ncbi:MAG: DUF4167 domain-containing protein [Pseudomonadota bacterium]